MRRYDTLFSSFNDYALASLMNSSFGIAQPISSTYLKLIFYLILVYYMLFKYDLHVIQSVDLSLYPISIIHQSSDACLYIFLRRSATI